MSRLTTSIGCLIFACLAPSLCAEEASTAAAQQGRDELAGLGADARAALAQGRVVLLETVSEEKVLGTKLVAVVDSSASDIVDALRDYDAMASFPEVRRVSALRGDEGDTLELTVKPHPLLPPMDFTKAVEWSLDAEGGAHLGMSLLSTSSAYVADQQADYRILPLEAGRSLVFYEARSTYQKLSFREKVLRRMCESSEKWLADVSDRAAARRTTEGSGAGALALLSTSGAVAAPLN